MRSHITKYSKDLFIYGNLIGEVVLTWRSHIPHHSFNPAIATSRKSEVLQVCTCSVFQYCGTPTANGVDAMFY